MRYDNVTIIVACILATLTLTAAADNWPQWRGGTPHGVSRETGIPTTWSKSENIAWRLPLPGPAGSTPVVWDDRIFLTTVADDRLELHCVGTDGQPRWKRIVATGNKDVRNDEGNSAAPSPSTDGQHVWTFMANGWLACYDMDGSEVWKTNLQDKFGKFEIQFGMTSTPVLDGDRLYVQLIHGKWDRSPHVGLIVALDKKTGKEIWRHERVTDAVDECKQSYASPVLYRDEDREFLIAHGGDFTTGHRLEDGNEIWRLGDLNPKGNYEPTLRFVASPACAPGIIVIPTAKNGKVVAIDPSAEGDITGSDRYIKWTMPQNTPDVPSPLIVDDLVYLCRENGNLICLDAKTGQRYYEERTTRDRHRASPFYADGHVYLTARNGTITVLPVGKRFSIAAQNSLDESMTASPIAAGGTLYLRTFEALNAVREE